jgi:hypothetical protein
LSPQPSLPSAPKAEACFEIRHQESKLHSLFGAWL